MKALLLFISIFIIFNSFSQDTIPVKRNNTIIVTMPDSGQALYKLSASTLLQNNFSIKSAMPDLLILNTDAKDFKYGTFFLNISIIKNQIFIRGTYICPVFGETPSSIFYAGMKGSAQMISWEDMVKFAKQFGGAIQYTTR